MTSVNIGPAEVDLAIVGVGVRRGYLPDGPNEFVLTEQEKADFEAFKAAGWKFLAQRTLDWNEVAGRNDDTVELGLLARLTLGGGLLILRDHLIVTVPADVAWTPPITDFRSVESLPLAPNIFDVRLNLPPSDLFDEILTGISRIHEVAPQEVRAEPFLVQRLVHRISSSALKIDPTSQLHWDQIHLLEAWNWKGIKGIQNDNTPTHVAIIDFGFDMREPQLMGQKGWWGDFHDDKSYLLDGLMPLPNPHGTFCAGLVGALLDNDGVNGSVPDGKLILVAVESVSSQQVSLTQAIRFCTSGDGGHHGADVICASVAGTVMPFNTGGYGSLMTSALQDAIDTALKNGRGNLGTPVIWADFNAALEIAPVSLEGYNPILLVGSIDQDKKHGACGFGDSLDLLAPGSVIVGITVESGASASAPMVAGVAALVIANKPGISRTDLELALKKGCDKAIDQQTDHDKYNGYGCVNALKSVK